VGGDEAAAEDVAQEAFVRAWRALGRFREEAKLETWFYRILVRQAANHRRWRALRTLWSAPAGDDAPDPSPRAPGDPALRRRIGAALERLTRSQREVFVLVHLEGFTLRETAELLARSEGTGKSHLHRALHSLREQLRDLVDERGGPQP
jgi:RNA polymerase sigma-70 factor (ECF subfamily)